MSQSLSVLHLNTERTWRGGEQQTLNLAHGLKVRGHRSAIVAQPGSPLVDRAREREVEVFENASRGEADPRAISRLSRLMKAFQPDIVHMHTSHAHTLGVLASKWAKFGKRVVSRRVDFSIYRHRLSLSGIKYRFGVDRFIAISDAVARVLIKDGIQASRIDLVPSGIDPDRYVGSDGQDSRKLWGADGSQSLVGTVAHFGWHKSLETLIRAAAIIHRDRPQVRFVLVGDGDLRPQLEEERRLCKMESVVEFAGFRTDIGNCLAALDVFVMPSVMEGLCTSILDALAMEKPVVASKVGGIPEIIEDGVTGRLVPPKDPKALAEGILAMIDDPDHARRLAVAGRNKVLSRFSDAAMVEGTLQVYRDVLEKA